MADSARRMGKPKTSLAPPLAVPLLFMGTGLVGAVAGSWFTVLHALPIVQGAFGSAPVLLVVHTLTLGFLTSTLMGALYQWVPVITGQALPSPRLAVVHWVCWAAGLVWFLSGLAASSPARLAAGGALLAVAVILFLTQLMPLVARGAQDLVPLQLVASALLYLLLTTLLGALLAAHLAVPPFAPLSAPRILGAHIVVAVAGWLGFTLIGVSYRLLPMFVVAPPEPGHARLVLVALHPAIVLGTVGLLGGWVPLTLAGAAAGVGALGTYLWDMAHVWRGRRSEGQDPPMLLTAVGLCGLTLVLGLGIAGSGDPALWAPLPALVLAVFLSSIVGFGQKIWPFMTWLHESRRRDARTVPHLTELWPPAVGWWLTGTGLFGIVAAAVALSVRSALLLQTGAGALGGLELALLVMVGRSLWVARYRRHPMGSRLPGGPR